MEKQNNIKQLTAILLTIIITIGFIPAIPLSAAATKATLHITYVNMDLSKRDFPSTLTTSQISSVGSVCYQADYTDSDIAGTKYTVGCDDKISTSKMRAGLHESPTLPDSQIRLYDATTGQPADPNKIPLGQPTNSVHIGSATTNYIIVYGIFSYKDLKNVTFKYYKDNSATGEFLGQQTLNVTACTANTGYSGINVNIRNYKAPAGYPNADWPLYDASPLVIRSDNQVVNIIYRKSSYNWVYQYLQDDLNGPQVGWVEWGSVGYGTVLTPNASQASYNQPAGYPAAFVSPGDSTTVTKDKQVIRMIYRKSSYGYKIGYYKSGDTKPFATATAGSVAYGTKIALTSAQINAQKPTGYGDGVVSTDTATIIREGQEIKVTYAPLNYKYTVNYYQDDLKGTSLGSVTGATASYGSKVTLSAAQLNAKQPSGYNAGKLDGTTDNAFTLSQDGQTINVVYQKSSYAYKIAYYRAGESQAFANVDGGSVAYGSNITLTSTQINAQKPTGYGDGVVSGETKITRNGQVISVTYQKLTFNWVFEYYQDDLDSTPLGSVTWGSVAYGTVITPNAAMTSSYQPAGYPAAFVAPGDSTTLTSNNMKIRMIYRKDSYSYKIAYYKNAETQPFITTNGASVPYGTSVVLTAAQLNAQKPAGFSNGIVSGDTKVIREGQIIKVIYNQSNYNYTIKYYQDDLNGTVLGTATGSALSNAKVTLTAAQLSAKQPSGYNAGKLDGTTDNAFTLSQDGQTINVVYQKSSYAYKIAYYKNTEAQPFITTNGLSVAYGTNVALTAAQLNAQKPVGFSDGVVSGETKVIREGQIIKVIYNQSNYNYTIKYYQDDLNGTVLGTATGSALSNSKVTLTTAQLNAKQPAGYNTGKVDGTTDNAFTLSQDGQTVNIVYQKSSYAYKIAYYKEGDNSPFITNAGGTVAYGTQVTLTTDVINAERPIGYNDGVVSGNTTITSDQQVIKVTYPKKASYSYTIEYYTVEEDGSMNNEGQETGSAAPDTMLSLSQGMLNAYRPTDVFKGRYVYGSGVLQNAPVTITTDGQIVKVYYMNETRTVVLNYLDMANNNELTFSMEIYYVGDVVDMNLYKKTITNYNFNYADKDSLTVSENGDNSITYYYTHK